MKVKVAAHYWRDWFGGWEFLDSTNIGTLNDPIVELDEDLIAKFKRIEDEYSKVCDEVWIAVEKAKASI